MDNRLDYAGYRKGLERGDLLGLRCTSCGEYVFPPTAACTGCRKTAMEVVTLSPSGKIVTFTVVRVAAAGFEPPFVVAMTELDQGPWVMGVVAGIGPEEATMRLIDRRVRIRGAKVMADPYSAGDRTTALFDLLDE